MPAVKTAGIFIYILRKRLLPWGRSCPRSGLMWGECALTARYRAAVARSALIRLRAGPQTPSPEGGRLPFYTSCSISSFFSGSSAAGSALKVRTPSLRYSGMALTAATVMPQT